MEDLDEFETEINLDSVDQEEESGEVPFEYDENARNLVFQFMEHPEGRSALKKIVDAARDDFDKDWDASAVYRQTVADNYKILAGKLPPHPASYKNAPNPNVPLMLENLTRLHMRIFTEVFGDWNNVFGVIPLGPEDEPIADTLSKHGNWQIRNQITDFKRQQRRALLLYLHNGDVSCESSFDPIRKRNRHEVLTVDDFVVPAFCVSVEPDYSDLPHYSRIIRMYRHELSRMRGIWHGVDNVLKGSAPDYGDTPNSPLGEAALNVKRIEVPEPGRHTPFKIIQYEGWIELPNQVNDRFCKVIFDYETKTVLHLSIHEEDNWQELIRYKQQLAELEMYRAAKEQYDALVAQAEAAYQDQRGLLDSETAGDWDKATANAALLEQEAAGLPPPPEPPAWMQDPSDPDEQPEPPRKTPIHMFSHGVCIEALTGPHGIGYGQLLADMNRCANMSMAQFAIAASLANSWGIITPSNVNFTEPFEISPGRQNKVKGMTGAELKNNIIELKPDPANPQLVEIAKFMVDWSQSATQSPGILSGEEGKSGETYRGVAARIEQATKQLTEVARGYASFVEQILKNNARLNSIYLPEEELVSVTSEIARQNQHIQVRRDMYERDYNIEFRSDLRFTSQAQRIAENDEILSLAMTNPYLQQNAAFVYQAIAASLKARGKQEFITLLGAPPPPPQQFMPPMVPGQEEGSNVGS